MPWIPRGLRDGIVTTRYPRRADGYDAGFRGSITVRSQLITDPARRAEDLCPTGAISLDGDGPRVDRGLCLLCGRCAEVAPDSFGLDEGVETASVLRRGLVVPTLLETDEAIQQARNELGREVRALRRSIHVRHIDIGSDGSDEWEVAALTNPVYDVQRLGIYFTASPHHADLLLVTGIGSVGMEGALRETLESLPEPKVLIAAGVDAISGGLIGAGYASHGGVPEGFAVDVFVPGSPPTPFGLLYGILLAMGRLPQTTPAGFIATRRRP